jgi:hypothetical protein
VFVCICRWLEGGGEATPVIWFLAHKKRYLATRFGATPSLATYLHTQNMAKRVRVFAPQHSPCGPGLVTNLGNKRALAILTKPCGTGMGKREV